MNIVVITKDNIQDIKKIIRRYKDDENTKIVGDSYLENEYRNIIFCANIKDKKERISYVYDYLCNYLDEDMKKNNYCDFIDGKCIANRLKKSVHDNNGCCYCRGKLCIHLKNGVCTSPNPTCKIFMCSYLNKYKKRNNYDTKKILLTSIFLNKKAHVFFRKNFFLTKTEFIDKYLNKVK